MKVDTPIRIAVSAGEISGDQHLAKVVRALQSRMNNISFKGMGGGACRSAGVETVVDSERMGGLMGFLEVVSKLKDVRSSLKSMKELLRTWKPDILIVVDYPDFHFQLASYAKKLGIKTFYFIPPKLWAWRKGRIRKIKSYFDHVAAIFPFEEKFYQDHGYQKVTFVGHPFCDDPQFTDPPATSHAEICKKYHLNPSVPIILLLPGSRTFEVERHLRTMIDGVRLLRGHGVIAQALVALPKSLQASYASLFQEPWLKYADESAVELMKISEVGVLKSGTCNLEAAFTNLPFVCVYWAPKFAEIIVRLLIGISEISPVNIIRSKTVRELLQKEFRPHAISQELHFLLKSERRNTLLGDFSKIRSSLSQTDRSTIFSNARTPYERVAALVVERIRQDV